MVLVGIVAPLLIQVFRLVLEKAGINLRGVGAYIVALVVSFVLAMVALQMTGGLSETNDIFAALAKVLVAAQIVYNLLKGKLDDWLPSKSDD
jgi:purine-cytosine permease-like protein